MFHNPLDSEIYIGSSNISRGALTSSIEWNYRFLKSNAPNDFKVFYDTFEDLFNNHSLVITDEVLKDYSKQWTRPNIYLSLIHIYLIISHHLYHLRKLIYLH